MQKIDLSMDVLINEHKLLLLQRNICLDPGTKNVIMLIDIKNVCQQNVVILFNEDDTDSYEAGYSSDKENSGTITMVYRNIDKQLKAVQSVGNEIEFIKMRDSILSADFNISLDSIGCKHLLVSIYQTENPAEKALTQEEIAEALSTAEESKEE